LVVVVVFVHYSTAFVSPSRNQRQTPLTCGTATSDYDGFDNITCTNTVDPLTILPKLYTYQKPRQKRKTQFNGGMPRRQRKQRNYWNSIDNLRHEITLFWEDNDVTISKYYHDQASPPIPSEYLLNQFNRNDLRWAIAQLGGREHVSYLLGGARIIPGRLNEAMELDEVKCLLQRFDTAKVNHDDAEHDARPKIAFVYDENSINATSDQRLATLASYSSAISTTKKERWTKERLIQKL
jgi:hypothetical protein